MRQPTPASFRFPPISAGRAESRLPESGRLARRWRADMTGRDPYLSLTMYLKAMRNRLMTDGFICPVCGYPEPESPAYDAVLGNWYQEICPSCGTQFGYDDAGRGHSELRARWIAGGAKWWSRRCEPPGFDGIEQLRAAGLLPETGGR